MTNNNVLTLIYIAGERTAVVPQRHVASERRLRNEQIAGRLFPLGLRRGQGRRHRRAVDHQTALGRHQRGAAGTRPVAGRHWPAAGRVHRTAARLSARHAALRGSSGIARRPRRRCPGL